MVVSNPQVPENLVYKLVSNFCVVTEIHGQPHQGYEEEEEFGCPIYSAEAVKFRLGCDFYSSRHETRNFLWTYTSPEFPMIQRAIVQKFVLPKPVLCIGGIMQIELLGRIIMHPLDDMYYVCVSNVQALGRNLSPQFDVEFIDESRSCILKHNPDTQLLGRTPAYPEPFGQVNWASCTPTASVGVKILTTICHVQNVCVSTN